MQDAKAMGKIGSKLKVAGLTVQTLNRHAFVQIRTGDLKAAHNKMQIHIGIGIASGEMIADYTGTQSRATYTCMGDTVNLAARIENHTKKRPEPIID